MLLFTERILTLFSLKVLPETIELLTAQEGFTALKRIFSPVCILNPFTEAVCFCDKSQAQKLRSGRIHSLGQWHITKRQHSNY